MGRLDEKEGREKKGPGFDLMTFGFRQKKNSAPRKNYLLLGAVFA